MRRPRGWKGCERKGRAGVGWPECTEHIYHGTLSRRASRAHRAGKTKAEGTNPRTITIRVISSQAAVTGPYTSPVARDLAQPNASPP